MTNYRIRVLCRGIVLFDDNVENIFVSQTNYVKIYDLKIASLEITKEKQCRRKNRRKKP